MSSENTKPAFESDMSPEERERMLAMMGEFQIIHDDGFSHINVRDGSENCPVAMISIQIGDEFFAFDAEIDADGYIKFEKVSR